jgi:YfiH family protein
MSEHRMGGASASVPTEVQSWFAPDWPLPPQVRSLITTRAGGASAAPFESFNLAEHVDDEPAHVALNRARLRAVLPSEPRWLSQVHGVAVADLDVGGAGDAIRADAAVTRSPGTVAAVLTADCLPVLLCAADGSVVGAAHAGWRGLCNGVLESCLGAMKVAPARVLAYLGPAISRQAYEVGDDVRSAFLACDASAAAAFVANARGRWQADLYALARQRLQAAGVASIHGGGRCTYGEPDKFFSFRRDGRTGRMASLIWIEC